MQINNINNFTDFCSELKSIGFCTAGSNEKVFDIHQYYGQNIRVHTGNKEYDPWEWRIRGLKECDFITYGKVFFKKAGWITKEWIPQFIAVRRDGKTFDELYKDGIISKMEKPIYNYIVENHNVSVHDLKVGIECNEQSKFNLALNNLQMKMLITMCDETFKTSKSGLPFGWPVTVFCTMEDRVGQNVIYECERIDKEEAFQNISQHIKKINSHADPKKIKNFILGNL